MSDYKLTFSLGYTNISCGKSSAAIPDEKLIEFITALRRGNLEPFFGGGSGHIVERSDVPNVERIYFEFQKGLKVTYFIKRPELRNSTSTDYVIPISNINLAKINSLCSTIVDFYKTRSLTDTQSPGSLNSHYGWMDVSGMMMHLRSSGLLADD